jgi:hypothetical protein
MSVIWSWTYFYNLNIFRLFVILSLTQLYRYTPEIFLFSTATFKYKYRAPLRLIGQEYSAKVAFSFLLRLVRVICLVIFEAKIVSPFAYFLFHDMKCLWCYTIFMVTPLTVTPQKTGKYFQDKRKIISSWLYFICISCV